MGRFRQVRASGHFMIADWYTKAFQTTGHALPLLEAIYHFVQCASFAPEAARINFDSAYKHEAVTDGSVGKYIDRLPRRGVWRAAVFRLIKCMRLGRPVLKLWLEEPVAAVWFGLKDQRRYVGQTTHGGSDLLEGLGNSIQGFESLTDAELLKDVTSEKRKKVERERVKAKNSWKALEPLVTHELLSIVNATRDLPIYSPPEGEAAADPLIGEWIQKWQRDGDLAVITENGLNTRNDSAWHKEIVARLKGLPSAPSEEAKALLNELAGLIKRLREVKENSLHNECRSFQFKVSLMMDDLPVSFLEPMGWLAYLWIRRAKRCEHARKQTTASTKRFPTPEGDDEKDVRKLWAHGCAMCRLVIDLAAHLHPRNLQAEVRLRVKLSALYGLALGRLDRYFEAHRRLNEASALLSKSDVFRDNPPLPILEIRRAEVHVLEAHLLGQIAAYFGRWKDRWDRQKNSTFVISDDAMCWE